MFKDRLNV